RHKMLPGLLRRRAAANPCDGCLLEGELESRVTLAVASAAVAVRRRSAAVRAAPTTRSSQCAHPAPGRPAHREQRSGLPGEPSPDAAANADCGEQFVIRHFRAWRSAGAPCAPPPVWRPAA